VTTAARVLDVARSQLGIREAADGSNPYGKAYGMDRVAWCNQFTWWCMTQAGGGPLTPKSAYTPTTYNWYRTQGRADRSPRPGSLVFFDFPDSLKRIQHVGFVEAVNPDGTITTIEGNTVSGAGGSQDRGGGVWRRRRSTTTVVGYGHPAYAGAAAPTTPAPRPKPTPPPAGFDPNSMRTLTYGARNDNAVAALQRFLNAHPWAPALPLLPVTGNYLGQTQGVVRRAQQQCGITGPDADGTVIGPRTKAAFAARGARW
jgi:hypothetical protein